ncbi:MAG: winged helix DNA-binding domain-containing protein [Actinomycetota bacterium]
MRHFDAAERRARIGLRHHLSPAARAVDVAGAAADLVAVHATDPASVVIGLGARVGGITPDDIEAALYDDRSVMRMLGMRRTLFVVARDVLPVVQAACTDAVATRERARLLQMLVDGGIASKTKAAAWLSDVERLALDALSKLGQATAVELGKEVEHLRRQVRVGIGKKWETDIGVGTRVLLVLAAEGKIARGRPRGTWISTQHRWATMDSWLGAPIEPLPIEVAQAELARRWLRAFGPALAADLKWWAGWTMAHTKRAVAAVDAVEVDLAGAVGYALPDDLDGTAAPEPWIALVAALDTTPMGWSERDWFLGPHRSPLFDRNGNIGATVWCDGRIVGGWAQRKSGEIVVRLLEDIGVDAAAAVEREAARLQDWLGAVRFTPRFPVPLQRELTA